MAAAVLLPGQRAWLVLLWIAWAALLFGGFVFGCERPNQARRMPAWTRMASSLALVLAGWSWFAFSGGQGAPLPLLIACGMTLGLMGDLCMAHLLPLAQPVLGGIAAFGLGHIAYIVGMLNFAGRTGLTAPGPRWAAWLAWVALGAAGWYLVVFRCQRATALHWAALPYALLLASTAGLATGLAVQAPALAPLAVGAALFLVSDLILAAHLFTGRHFYLIDDVIWLTYGPGQMLIVYSLGRALAIL